MKEIYLSKETVKVTKRHLRNLSASAFLAWCSEARDPLSSYQPDQRPKLAPAKQDQSRHGSFSGDIEDEKRKREQGRMEKREGDAPFSAGEILFRIEE